MNNREKPSVLRHIHNQYKTEYYLVGELLHREDGPAEILYENGKIIRESYFVKGIRHRDDGPAVIHYNLKGETIYAANWVKGTFYGDTIGNARKEAI